MLNTVVLPNIFVETDFFFRNSLMNRISEFSVELYRILMSLLLLMTRSFLKKVNLTEPKLLNGSIYKKK